MPPSADLMKLLELCGLFGTLVIDEDGIYDMSDFNDRLLIGLKGTMGEAELHFLHARMIGGKENAAAKGELRSPSRLVTSGTWMAMPSWIRTKRCRTPFSPFFASSEPLAVHTVSSVTLRRTIFLFPSALMAEHGMVKFHGEPWPTAVSFLLFTTLRIPVPMFTAASGT